MEITRAASEFADRSEIGSYEAARLRVARCACAMTSEEGDEWDENGSRERNTY